jgi:hypothetical protein
MRTLTNRNIGCKPIVGASGGATDDTVEAALTFEPSIAAHASAWGPPPE